MIDSFENEKESILKLWKEIVKENAQYNLSHYVETILLYICASAGKVNDEFLEYLNVFSYSKYTKKEAKELINTINNFGAKTTYIIPSFIIRLLNKDWRIILDYVIHDFSISNDDGIQIRIDSKKEVNDDIKLEAFNAMFVLVESVATGLDIDSYASDKPKTFITYYKKLIKMLLYNWWSTFDKDDKRIITKRLKEIDFDKHDNNVAMADSDLRKKEDYLKNQLDSLSYKDCFKRYIQECLIYLWSSNEDINNEMLQYFNSFSEYQYSKEQVLSAMNTVGEADYSCFLPFDFMHYINQDLINGTCETRYYNSLLQMIFVYGAYLSNSLYLETLNIIENSTDRLNKLCEVNKVVKDTLADSLNETSIKQFNKLKNEIIELEMQKYGGAFKYKKYIIRQNSDDLFANIILYIESMGCITKDDVSRYLTMPALVKDEIDVIRKALKKGIKYSDFDIKIKLINYIMKYVKRYYDEDDNSWTREFIESSLDELLKYITFYDQDYVKRIKCHTIEKSELKIELPEVIINQAKTYFDIGNIEQSLLKDKSMLRDLFSYPARVLNRFYKMDFGENTLILTSNILEQTLITNQIDFTNELIQLLHDSNSEYCNKTIKELFKSLGQKKVCLNASQIKVLLPYTNLNNSKDLYASILNDTIKSNDFNGANEIFELLYEFDSTLFADVFNFLVLTMCDNGKILPDEQIEFLNKWTKYTNKEDFNNFAISIKEAELTENQTKFIQSLVSDIVKNENDIVNCIKVFSNKEHVYYVYKLIINNSTENNSQCLFQILDNYSISTNLTNSMLLNDDELIGILIDLSEEKTEKNNVTLPVFLKIFNAFNKNSSKPVDFFKKLIDNKPILASKLLEKILLDLGNKKPPKYIDLIVEYANSKQIDEKNKLRKYTNTPSYNVMYDELQKRNKLKMDESINLTEYILSIDSKLSDGEIVVLDEKINKLLIHRIKETEFDFEKVIEYIIKNKDFFLHKSTVHRFNYAEWFFEVIEKTESEEVLNRLINNDFIITDIYNNIKVINNYALYIVYKDYYGHVKLLDYLIDIFLMKYDNNEVVSLVLKFVNKLRDKQEIDKFFNTKELIEKCYDEDNYSTREKIDKFNSLLINNFKNELRLNKKLPEVQFYKPNMTYLLFIVKACEKDYEFVFKLLQDYALKEDDHDSINNIIYEIYKVYGMDMVKKIVCHNDKFKKEFFKYDEYSLKLITKIKRFISENDAIIMLDFIINNFDSEKEKYRLLTKILSSNNYRETISSQELDYFYSIITGISDGKYKKELMHKYKLLLNRVK